MVAAIHKIHSLSSKQMRVQRVKIKSSVKMFPKKIKRKEIYEKNYIFFVQISDAILFWELIIRF